MKEEVSLKIFSIEMDWPWTKYVHGAINLAADSYDREMPMPSRFNYCIVLPFFRNYKGRNWWRIRTKRKSLIQAFLFRLKEEGYEFAVLDSQGYCVDHLTLNRIPERGPAVWVEVKEIKKCHPPRRVI